MLRRLVLANLDFFFTQTDLICSEGAWQKSLQTSHMLQHTDGCFFRMPMRACVGIMAVLANAPLGLGLVVAAYRKTAMGRVGGKCVAVGRNAMRNISGSPHE